MQMKTLKRFAAGTAAAAIMISLGACSGMSQQGRDTAIGAGIGGVAGNVLTNGSTLGTVGGAAVGGAVGHEIRK
jgi:osmotically inducible lipoprotein OsmB